MHSAAGLSKGLVKMKSAYAAALLGAVSIFAVAVTADAATVFPPRLFLSSDGVALSSFPSRHTLDQKIVVTPTQGKTAVTWNAISDQPWLTVTPSGTTGQALRLHANPHRVARDQELVANVTVSSSDANFTDTETLRVGFWVGSSDPQNLMLKTKTIAASMTANPVEPIVYVSNGAPSIQEYNVYSGALTGTIGLPLSADKLEVSSDGRILYCFNQAKRELLAVDTATGAILHEYVIGGTDFVVNMVYARPFGQPALYFDGGPIVAYPSGDILAGNLPAQSLLAVTPNGTHIFSVDYGSDASSLTGWQIRLSNGALKLQTMGSSVIDGENCEDLAVSGDGSLVYPTCGWPYEFDAFSGKTLSKVQTLQTYVSYPSNVETDARQHVVFGSTDYRAAADVSVFDRKGNAVGTVQNVWSQQQPQLMKISGDATRVVTSMYLFDPPYLVFRDMP